MKQLSLFVERWDEAVIITTLDGVIATWNDGARQLYGYLNEEIIGKHISVLTCSDTNENILNAISDIKERKHIPVYNTIHQRKDNTLIQVSLSISPVIDETANIIAASIIAHDITEYKQSENILGALMNSSQLVFTFYRVAFSNMSAGSLLKH